MFKYILILFILSLTLIPLSSVKTLNKLSKQANSIYVPTVVAGVRG